MALHIGAEALSNVRLKTVYECNLEALGPKGPKVAEAISNAAEPVVIEKARSGGETFRYKGKLFHSLFEPEKEARLQAGEVLAGKADWVILFGLGCGHILKELTENGKEKVLVYEPSIEILKGVLENIDLSSALGRKDVWICPAIEGLISRVRAIDGFDDIVTVQTAPYRKAFPKELADFINKISNAHTTNKVSIATEIDSCLMWNENYFSNIEAFSKYPPIDSLRNKFKGMPMVIAGAGPSLKKNAHLLKELKGKAVIVAAVTAYKPLLKYGVIPDFVIAAEKVDLPEYFTYGEEDLKTRFILGEVSHPNMFGRDVLGKFVYFNCFNKLSREQAGFWGSNYFPSSGGSVTTSAFDIGMMFGCDPIIFVGQDLAFGDDGRTHAAGGVYIAQDVKFDKEKGTVSIDEDYINPAMKEDKLQHRFKLLWLKGLDGKPVASKFDWVTFHQWFENQMRSLKDSKNATRVINATEGGAWIEGMEHLKLADVINEYNWSANPIEETISRTERERTGIDYAGLNRSFDGMEAALKSISRSSREILEEAGYLRKRFNSGGLKPEYQRSVDKIKRHEKKLFEKASGADFIWEALISYTYLLKDYYRKETELDDKKQFEIELDNIQTSFNKIDEVCKRFMPVIKNAKSSVKEAQAAAKNRKGS